jgi:hypothetical protein
MIVFNGLGGIMAAASILPGILLGVVTRSFLLGAWLAGFGMIAADVVYRCNRYLNLPRKRRPKLWFVWPWSGGMFCYLPVWGFGILLLISGVVGHFQQMNP